MAVAYILDAVRTAGGKREGALDAWHPLDSAASTLDALIARTGLDPSGIEERDRDEGIRADATPEVMGTVEPLQPGGIITAVNVSQIYDGPAALLVASAQAVRDQKLSPIPRVIIFAVTVGDPVLMIGEPLAAMDTALRRTGRRINEMELYEVEKAFAPVPLAWSRHTGGDPKRLSINGGAIALGHPLGASGVKLLATAKALVSVGVGVTILDINPAAAEAAAEGGTHFVVANVTSNADIDRAFAAARAVNGRERILASCVGTDDAIKTMSRDRGTGHIKRCLMDKVLRIITINLIGTFRCIAAAAAAMLTIEPDADGQHGEIINTGSVADTDGQMGQARYAGFKAAILGMTLPQARDLMGESICVNTLLPCIFRYAVDAGFI